MLRMLSISITFVLKVVIECNTLNLKGKNRLSPDLNLLLLEGHLNKYCMSL
jgi:hypothetical protein